MADPACLSSSLISLPLASATANLHSCPLPCAAAPPFRGNVSPASSVSIVAEQNAEVELIRRRLLTLATVATVGSFMGLGTHTGEACAFSFGISGPKEWLKGQKRKASKFLLAPISASRDRLNEALFLLTQDNSVNNYLEAKNLVKIAARDCKPVDPGSFASFQANTGVEVCTFRLVLKNAASLLDDANPIKSKANVALKNLIDSFICLDEFLMNDNLGASFSRISHVWSLFPRVKGCT
ncbi:hypothetical protein O6H91_07G042200 [Diphasiastrum complanatum]|uniref:Uncharacterized protein n=2 Tax=Diphasiastrum complanatum TaxID=34168 RepID=A0ACC2D4E1_DIPCM|nr:hypothetical protein O6H91_07G042200 [Diphasiastrum complanatum]